MDGEILGTASQMAVDHASYNHISLDNYKFELSEYHQIFYNEWKLDPQAIKYNIVFDQSIIGSLNLEKIVYTFRKLVSEHVILNSHIEEINGFPYWVKNSSINDVAIYDEASKSNIYKFVSKKFNLNSDEPLYRFAVFVDNDNEYRIVVVLHHIIIDGGKFDALIEKISAYYNNEEIFLPTTYEQIKLIENTNQEVAKSILNKAIVVGNSFWSEALDSVEPIDTRFLKYVNLDEVLNESGVGLYEFCFSEDYYSKLQFLKSTYDLTPYQYGQIIFAILIYRYTSQESFAMAYPAAIKEYNALIYGASINTNVFVYKIVNESTLKNLIDYYKSYVEKMLDTGANYVPVNRFIDHNNSQLLDVFFAQTNLKHKKFDFFGVDSKVNNEFYFDLVGKIGFEQQLIENVLHYRVKYNQDQVGKEILADFIECYKKLFTDVLNDLNLGMNDRKVTDYQILNDVQYRKIVYEWNQTERDFPRDKTIHQLFEEQVERTPENIALVYEDKVFKYLELNQRANQLANYLKDLYQVQGDYLIALCLDRNEYMLISILAVLKSGGAYVPIDSSYSDNRISYLLKDSRAKILLINEIHEKRFNELVNNVAVEVVEQQIKFERYSKYNLISNITSKNLAYIIYTSGTTGKPKGVMVEHRSLVNLVTNQLQIFGISHSYKNQVYNFLLYASYVFDAHLWDLFMPICYGHVVHLISNRIRSDFRLLKAYIKKQNIDIATIPPAVLNSKDLLPLKILIVAGEKTGVEIFIAYSNAGVRIVNAYGPTESTICVAFHSYNEKDSSLFQSSSNIGRPLFNIKLYILGVNFQPLPIGAIGELYIGGEGLARGYLNRDELTRKHFIANVFQLLSEKEQWSNTRLYKTGDLARYLPDGSIEYIERNDSQIKVRGYRIELGEINEAIASFSEVKQVATFWQKNQNDNHIVAYYVSDNKLTYDRMYNYLLNEIPSYMIPKFFIRVSQIPLNINGKVDKNKLCLLSGVIDENLYVPPETESEKLLCDSFSKVLKLEKVGLDDNFFKLGGDSILVIDLVQILQEFFEIYVADVFELRTPRKLASVLVRKDDFLVKRLEYIKALYAKTKLDNYRNRSYLYNPELKLFKFSQKEIKSILLTGSTGYLGINILNQLINQTNYIVFLLIRGKSHEDSFCRINDKYKKYFNQSLDMYLNSKIFIVTGDFSINLLGLSNDEYMDLVKHVDSVIHCGALVKHYGMYEEFYKINVLGTSNVLEFTNLTKLKDFHYISTYSVLNFSESKTESETRLPDELVEANFYVKTKLIGEHEVLKFRRSGVNANIYRVGNLAFSSQNVMLQDNIDDNAFFYWIKCIFELKCIPEELSFVEVSPVDWTANAFVKLFDKKLLHNGVYHLFNPNPINIYDTIAGSGMMAVKQVTIEYFINLIIDQLKAGVNKFLIMRFLLKQGWLDSLNSLELDWVSINQEKTDNFLKYLGFEWNTLNSETFAKYLEIINNLNNKDK